MKVHEVLTLLESDGWYLARTSGSHRQYKHPIKPGRVIHPRKAQQRSPPGTPAEHPQASRTQRTVIPVDEHSYLVVIERGAGNYGAWAPDLPGCVAVGDTPDECEKNMREAIAFHIDGLREDGLPVPGPSVVAASLVQLG